jgi:superfamily I DNA/RNA helicase
MLDFLGAHANTCVLGDDDQSIYGFKYAHPQGSAEFPEPPRYIQGETRSLQEVPRRTVQWANILMSNYFPRPSNHSSTSGTLAMS